MHAIESIRKEDQSVLLLDCGGVFDHHRDTAELMLKAMELMKYDALNLGTSDFQFGNEFLERSRSRVSFPYIASNLLYQVSRLPWTSEYIIKEAGGIKVAILGILDPDDLAKYLNKEQVKMLHAIPPETALKRLLPEVREKADLVILLSGLGTRETEALIKAVKGIDVALSVGNNDPLLGGMPENTILLHTGYLGRELGLLKITLDDKRTLSVTDKRRLLLDRTVADNAEIAGLVNAFKKAANLAKEQAEQQEKRQHREYMEGLKLSPQEFMERLQKEQQSLQHR